LSILLFLRRLERQLKLRFCRRGWLKKMTNTMDVHHAILPPLSLSLSLLPLPKDISAKVRYAFLAQCDPIWKQEKCAKQCLESIVCIDLKTVWGILCHFAGA